MILLLCEQLIFFPEKLSHTTTMCLSFRESKSPHLWPPSNKKFELKMSRGLQFIRHLLFPSPETFFSEIFAFDNIHAFWKDFFLKITYMSICLCLKRLQFYCSRYEIEISFGQGKPLTLISHLMMSNSVRDVYRWINHEKNQKIFEIK